MFKYRHLSGLTRPDLNTTMRAHLYFSAKARAKAERNLSIETWASGVKSAGNRMARTTRMLWAKIYGKTQKTNSGEMGQNPGWIKTKFHCAHLEIGGINSQLESMKLAEVQKSSSKVVDFGNSLTNASHHSLPVLLHWSRAGAQVLPVREIGFGLWVDRQHPIGRHSELNPRDTSEESVWLSIADHKKPYLLRASCPMSSAFPETLAQRALTAALSLAVRLMVEGWVCRKLLLTTSKRTVCFILSPGGHTQDPLTPQRWLIKLWETAKMPDFISWCSW